MIRQLPVRQAGLKECDVAEYDFSVVIPTFNSEAVVRKAISSAQKQGDARVQIIVVDGASQDATCEAVMSGDCSNIILVSEPDSGVYEAMNKGIALAEGHLIGVLGSDDTYFPEVLPIVRDAQLESNAPIVAGLTKIGDAIRADEPYGFNSLISGIPFGHNAMFVTREAYASVGPYNLQYSICADADWVHRAIRKGLSCQRLEKLIVDFGVDGLSSTQSEKIMDETYTIISSHFTNLTKDEAKTLLFAARKWAPSNAVAGIMQRHGCDHALMQAIASAFPDCVAEGGRSTAHEFEVLVRSSFEALRRVISR